MNARLGAMVRSVADRVRRRSGRAPQVATFDPVALQVKVEALDDVERADLGKLAAGQRRVQGLAQQRPELAVFLAPVVEASRSAGRDQVVRLLDGRERR